MERSASNVSVPETNTTGAGRMADQPICGMATALAEEARDAVALERCAAMELLTHRGRPPQLILARCHALTISGYGRPGSTAGPAPNGRCALLPCRWTRAGPGSVRLGDRSRCPHRRR